MSPALLGGLIAVLAVLGIGGFLLFGPKSAPAPVAEPVAPAPVQPVVTGPTPEELQAQIEALVAEKTKDLEAGLREQADATIKVLQEQLKQAEAQRAAAEKAAQQQEADRLAAATKAAEPTKAPEPVQVAEVRPVEPETKAPAATTSTAPTTASPSTTSPGTTASGTSPATVAETKGPAATKAPVSAPPPMPAAPVTTTRPAAATARTGDLVALTSDINPPRMTKEPVSRFPDMARRMNQRQATVRVKVLVDENGKVIDSQLVGAEVGYGFDREALRAAQTAEFQPATTRDGVRVKVWYEFKINFRG